MITDPEIREQAYQYFLEEAPELLQTIEEELLSLRELTNGDRPLKINNLMRAAHTLKGGAANVGLEAINKVSHTLEDVFKALYNPELEIDPDIQTLLFQNYECLRLLLTAEFNHGVVDEEQILNKSASIFVELQEIIGDCWTDQDAFPTSEELGLDVVESFFKEIIPERFQEISAVIDGGDEAEIVEVLSSQAEVFVGLAESLGLPGFKSISETILAAIDRNPDSPIQVAKVALANLEEAQKQVLAGDRDRGGEPNSILLKFATGEEIPTNNSQTIADVDGVIVSESPSDVDAVAVNEYIGDNNDLFEGVSSDESGELVDEIWGQQAEEEELSETENIDYQEILDSDAYLASEIDGEEDRLSLTEVLSEEVAIDTESTLVDEIWGQQTESKSATNITIEEDLEVEIEEVAVEEVKITQQETEQKHSNLSDRNISQKIASSEEKKKTKAKKKKTQNLRVNLASLEKLNNQMGELLIEHNKNYVRNDNINNLVQYLLENARKNEELLSKINESITDNKIVKSLQEASNQKYLLEIEKELGSVSVNNSETIKILEEIKSDNQQYRRDWQKQQQIVLNMRDELIETRMSPIGKIFNRFPHMLEQLAHQHGKKLDLKITGNHILIDKAVEDKLYDPLLHIIRNAFDHGLESPEERSQVGKSETGTIELRAYYQGSQTIIEVRDDGKGIKLEKIKNRAIERNLLAPDRASQITPSQVLEFLFEPGFSTASKVSNLSGRGVGLDIVRSQVESMNGSVTIESVPQQGTTFSLQIPLTLTIARLMLTEAGGVVYSLLVDSIERIILPTSKQIKIFNNQKVLHWETDTESHMVPVQKLSQLIQYTRLNSSNGTSSQLETYQKNNTNPVLLLKGNTELIGLEVDRILGEQELVIRPVGSAIAPPAYVYGCSVLSDSSLTLVIDPIALIKEMQNSTLYESAYLADSAQKALPTSSTPLLPGQTIVPLTLLLVDDSSSHRKTTKLSLEKISAEILEAVNGLDALEKLQKSKNINLIVCDLEMPHMNGFQLLKAIGQNSNLTKIPVIMLTSRGSERFKQLARELGAAAYLTKPFQEQELIETILDLVG